MTFGDRNELRDRLAAFGDDDLGSGSGLDEEAGKMRLGRMDVDGFCHGLMVSLVIGLSQ